MWPTPGHESPLGIHTFLFSDLAGFTAPTEAHGDESAAGLAQSFCREVGDLLPVRRGELVKQIGDSAMVRLDDAGDAVRLGVDVVYDLGGRHGFPAIRVGMHTGTAVERDGDWFGAAVNLAARVAGHATGGEVLLSDETRVAAGEQRDFRLFPRGRTELRNVGEPVLLHAVRRRGEMTLGGAGDRSRLRMAVDRSGAAGVLSHEGRDYLFCSLRCAQTFARTPERYAQATAG